MTIPISLRDLRIFLKLTHQEMCDLLGIGYSHYSMAEGRKRKLPASSLIRIFEIHKILSDYKPAQTETSSSLQDFLIPELKSMATAADIAQKRQVKKENAFENSVRANEFLRHLLMNFDLLAENSTDPELDSKWKAAMESKVKEPNPGLAKLTSIRNRIESECLALRIRLIQEELEAIQNPG